MSTEPRIEFHYPMSDSPIYIVDLDVTLEDAPAFANSGMSWMEAMCIAVRSPGAEVAFSPVSHAPAPGIARWAKWVNEQSTNGIGAIVGRRVYNAGPQKVEALRCPCCSAEHDAASLPVERNDFRLVFGRTWRARMSKLSTIGQYQSMAIFTAGLGVGKPRVWVRWTWRRRRIGSRTGKSPRASDGSRV